MLFEKYLKQFWRCVEVRATGEDEEMREVYAFDEKVCGKDLILSGLHLDYDEDELNAPASLVFNVWKISGDELIMDYYQTGHVHEFKPIKNGFEVVTGNDEKGSTTYVFKKTKVNPFQKFEQKKLRKRITEIADGTADLQEHELIEE